MSVDRSDRTTVAQPGGTGPEPPSGTDPSGTESHAPAPPLTTEDRRAAFAAGAPRMPRKVILLGIAALLAIGVTGALADRFATSSTPAPASSQRSPTGHSGPVVPHHGGTTSTVGSELKAPLAAFMGLNTLKGAAAANFTLTDSATQAPVSLSGLAGHVVVLAFANGPCNDICPILAKEMAQADTALGSTAVPVTFVTINTDPLALAPGNAAILTKTPLGALPNFRFLTGSVKQLNRVWTTYGISITVNRATRATSHNELMYFITPAGKIAWAATPFANESTKGTYSLPAPEISRFAEGIAHYARKLAVTR